MGSINEANDEKGYETTLHAEVNKCSDVQKTNSSHEETSTFWTLHKICLIAQLCLINFVMFGAVSIISPFLPTEALDRDVSNTMVGIIFGSYPFTVFIFSPIFGRLISNCGQFRVLICGLIAESIALFLFGLCELLSDASAFSTLCLVLRITSAIGGAALETATFSIALEEFPDDLAVVTGVMETFTGVGFAMGPALGGLLYAAGGFKLPFIVMGCLMIAVTPIFFLTLAKNQAGSSFGFLDPILGPHLQLVFGMTVTAVGLVFFIQSGAYAVLTPIIGWFTDKTVSVGSIWVLVNNLH
ncbi:hypothetical protein OS493_026028 [Desmophyllum pertusum]|uniref:Major facilitator superfamily (MFS) profile domain-containing protein n=1 Tax=Desmophyllum pertusum TaxID=174260 RepID=A0A9X0CKP0_9CNID|nr:hypothetical protein OS493_026028 [Desmophyllum pertusum]